MTQRPDVFTAPERLDGVTYGFTLSSEEHPPEALVRFASAAESAGFEYVSISDHFHPWINEQGNSPFVWSVIGAIAQATERIGVGTGVTCPIGRIHPAVLAQASATSAALLGGAFAFGVGTGEALNEHITGMRWPRPEVRLEMLEEAVDIIRRLWTGDVVDHRGPHFEVENARIYSTAPGPIPLIVSAFGPKATQLAARVGDGLWTSSVSPDTVSAFREAGGTGPVLGQLTMCWDESRDRAIETVHRIWPNAAVPGQLSQDLPTPTHFEQAIAMVRPEDVASSMPVGPDIDAIVAGVEEFTSAGYTHVHIHQVGERQDDAIRIWREEIAARLPGRAVAAR